jgi:hypothetical protein
MAEKMNTAEHDSKGLCIRHPTIRLRKKKLFGGWKIVIGHCPECCLDEMRRVRDEIERQELSRNTARRRDDDDSDSDSDDETDEEEMERQRIKKKKKKKKEKKRSETRNSPHKQQYPVQYQQEQQYPPQQYHQPPPPTVQQRIMVLSMAFVDPKTGSRGTYTGQVNSLNHKPDGKGTVYYTNGSVAEGTWENGTLLRSSSQDPDSQQGIRSSSSRPPTTRASSMQPPGKRHPHDMPGNFSGGNLDKLDRLNRKGKSRPNIGSASVQSFNSRGSVELPFGSASVQLDHGGGGVVKLSSNGSHQGFLGEGSGGPVNAQYQKRGSTYKPSPRKIPEYR